MTRYQILTEKFKPGTLWKVMNDSVEGPEHFYAFIVRQHTDCFSYETLGYVGRRAIGFNSANHTWIRVS
jgi:hypothetical protein